MSMAIHQDHAKLNSDVLANCARSAGFVLLLENGRWRIYREPERIVTARNAPQLASLLAAVEDHTKAGGEAAGFLTYEAGYALEPKLNVLSGAEQPLLGWFGLFPQAEFFTEGISAPGGTASVHEPAFQISYDRYSQRIAAIRDWIGAGDVYQVNFTDRILFGAYGDPWLLFCELAAQHPAPYAAFINTGREQILSLSPELFFQIDGRRILAKPMKGTCARGRTLREDIAAAEDLHLSEKNRAENVMIVDLMRSDLGRICENGSVVTPRLFEVTRFPSLWQMTSSVEGRLRNEVREGDVIRALFPSGSVTGAPKIRAMQIIAKLEFSARGVYTGAIGYFAPHQAQFSVAIRTAVIRGATGTLGVGSGIVYDSSPRSEFDECALKAAFLTRRTPDFQIIETLLWDQDFRLLPRHLERMSASAEYFAFSFDRSALEAELAGLSRRLDGGGPRRVRITLNSLGRIEIQDAPAVGERHERALLSKERVSSSDVFLFHKTTHRPLHDRELAKAREFGCDDVLFLNEKGEVTEGAIHNVFVRKDGVWRTPPIPCGLLPGVFRAEFLATHADALEEPLRLEDLLAADQICLCNSVRGMYVVTLVEQASMASPGLP